MKIGIDLTWVKHNKSGGIESYIRNLLDGLLYIDKNNEYYLLVTVDNEDSFEKYFQQHNVRKEVVNLISTYVFKRILWQNIYLNRLLIKRGINLCFEPIYSKPLLRNKKVRYVCTIHDLQALHYPEYFSKIKYIWMRFAWRRSIRSSDKIIAISNFVRNDILRNYNIDEKKVEVIYNPIVLNDKLCDFDEISKLYGISKNEYYYTVSQLLPHKNLETLLYVFIKIRDENINLPCKLLISGVSEKQKSVINKIIKENKLENNVLFTGFVSNDIRNTLYKNCRAFLFPSIFEGFGMPPIEAMSLGSITITTRCTSLYEVTKGKANYVNEPKNIENWIDKMLEVKDEKKCKIIFEEYSKIVIANEYLKVLQSI